MATVIQQLFGRILKIHGCEGAVVVRTEKFFYDNIPEMESVFLEIEGRRVPFFIDHYQSYGNSNVLIWLRDYNSVEKIKEFVGINVFILSGDNSLKTDDVQDNIIGFELITKENELWGIITRVTENPGQLLLSVTSKTGSEILIPLHEDLIISIEKELKRIVMNLPEGLRNLN